MASIYYQPKETTEKFVKEQKEPSGPTVVCKLKGNKQPNYTARKEEANRFPGREKKA